MRRVKIEASGTYDILIGGGLIDQAGARLLEAIGRPCRAAVVSDDVVWARYGGRVEKALGAAGFGTSAYVFPNGEPSKSMDTLGAILEWLARERFTRADIIVALGGGVVGDMAGFAAAVYARGVRYMQIPTTLLAAVDSSVGGKTAVNLNAGKNMAGAFKQPALVLCDTDILRELPANLLSDGAAEIIKYGVLNDAALFEQIAGGDWADALSEIVERCVSIKAEYVAEDEFDENRRQFLNLGHTFGHAAEKLSRYALPHGQGVAIGMAMIARAAHAMGMLADDAAVERVERALVANGLPVACPYPPEEMERAALLDKKRRGDTVTLIVPEAIGRCTMVEVAADELREWIEAGYRG